MGSVRSCQGYGRNWCSRTCTQRLRLPLLRECWVYRVGSVPLRLPKPDLNVRSGRCTVHRESPSFWKCLGMRPGIGLLCFSHSIPLSVFEDIPWLYVRAPDHNLFKDSTIRALVISKFVIPLLMQTWRSCSLFWTTIPPSCKDATTLLQKLKGRDYGMEVSFEGLQSSLQNFRFPKTVSVDLRDLVNDYISICDLLPCYLLACFAIALGYLWRVRSNPLK